jgi:hypothetical protein
VADSARTDIPTSRVAGVSSRFEVGDLSGRKIADDVSVLTNNSKTEVIKTCILVILAALRTA